MAEPIDLSRMLIERFNERDLEAMVGLFDDDVVFVRPAGEVLHGRDQVRARYEQDWQTFTESRVDITNAVSEGSTVAAEIRMRLRHGDRLIEADGAVFHRWENGLIVRYRAFLEIPPL